MLPRRISAWAQRSAAISRQASPSGVYAGSASPGMPVSEGSAPSPTPGAMQRPCGSQASSASHTTASGHPATQIRSAQKLPTPQSASTPQGAPGESGPSSVGGAVGSSGPGAGSGGGGAASWATSPGEQPSENNRADAAARNISVRFTANSSCGARRSADFGDEGSAATGRCRAPRAGLTGRPTRRVSASPAGGAGRRGQAASMRRAASWTSWPSCSASASVNGTAPAGRAATRAKRTPPSRFSSKTREPRTK
jgi:hypothetical protein